VLGTLSASAPGDSAGGAINVVLSPDDRFAFVSLEDAGVIAVFNLHAALADGFRRSAFVGQIRLGVAPIGMAISPDGRWLYATSEAVAGPLGGAPTDGTVSVVDLRSAERSPANAVLARATAGCSPTRVIVSADGNVVWVSARSSDELLAFSANRLRSDPSRALLSATRVGEAPVGTALVDQGRQIVVTDSNQFDTPGARSGLTVVDTAAALAGRPALLGVVKAGAFPRLLSIAQDGKTLLITNFASRQLESIQLDQLP
jgi:DNA-binding beta-propeller fold protein YncE